MGQLATSDSPPTGPATQTPTTNDPPIPIRAPLISLIVAEAIAMLGNRMLLVAVPWLVLTTTGSPAKMGLVGGAAALALVLASVFGAPLVDRFGMRRVAITADLAAAGTLVVIGTGQYGGFWNLLVLMAINAALAAVGIRAKRVLLAPVAQAAGAHMRRVTAIYEGLNRSATLVGASVGGFILAAFSPLTAIWLNAAALLTCATLVAYLVDVNPTAADDTDPHPPGREPYLSAIRTGFRHVRADRLMVGMMTMLVVTNLINQAMSSVLLPLWVDEATGSPVALGILSAAFASGAIAGNIVFAILATRLPRYYTLTLGYLIGGAPRFLALTISHDLTMAIIVMVISGIAISTVNPTYGALLYERVPPRLHARVFGLSAAVITAGMPLGGLLGGLTVEQFGLDGALLCATGLYLCAAMIPLRNYRVWRELDGVPARGGQRGRAAKPRRNSSSRLRVRPHPARKHSARRRNRARSRR